MIIISKVTSFIAVTASMFVLAGLSLALPVATYAATPQEEACTSIGGTYAGGKCTTTTAGGGTVESLLSNVINLFSIIVGVIAVVMIIVGGLKYITSRGDSSSVSSAKNTILYAVVGLVVAALAQFLVHYVLARVK